MRILGIILLILTVSVSGFAQEKPSPTKKIDTAPGPFGLRMGMTKEQLGSGLIELAPHKFTLTKIPKPHQAFESYGVWVGPTTGLCFIRGVGKDIPTDVYGAELVAQYNILREQLAKVYGNYSEEDYLDPDSMWNEPRDWMRSLERKDRVLRAFWSEEEESTLKPTLKYINLSASAQYAEKGYLEVEYVFDNFDKCEEEISAEEGEAL